MTFYHCLLILDRAKAYIKVQGDASYDCHIPSQDPIYSSIAGDISLQNPLCSFVVSKIKEHSNSEKYADDKEKCNRTNTDIFAANCIFLSSLKIFSDNLKNADAPAAIANKGVAIKRLCCICCCVFFSISAYTKSNFPVSFANMLINRFYTT